MTLFKNVIRERDKSYIKRGVWFVLRSAPGDQNLVTLEIEKNTGASVRELGNYLAHNTDDVSIELFLHGTEEQLSQCRRMFNLRPLNEGVCELTSQNEKVRFG